MPRISIVMPVYNSAKYLKEAINSILDQTFADWEFIIINELGSEDGSREIIQEYAEIDHRIILVQNENRLGIAGSMNVGFDMAKGEYIARMDADDISLPDRFKKQVWFMDSNPDIGMCGTKVLIFGSNSVELDVETGIEKLDTNILFYSPSIHPTVMIRKSLIDKYNLRYNPNFKASEDYELFSKICEVSKIANIDEVLFRYRIMENNTTFKNSDIGAILYNDVMKCQFEKMGLSFTEDEIKLLSPHYSMKGAKYDEVIERLIKLDLLLKKILVANESVKIYDRKYLSNTLHKRYNDAYKSISWACKDYDGNKVNEFYKKSIFINEYFYEGYKVKNDFKPVVTVLMPAFNSEKYIADTIWSVLNQSYKNFELLIVNEFGSNDNTVKIINMFNDERIRIIQNKERLGLAESLNIGIREAKGKYIARIDADDLCDVERLRLQVEFMDKNLEYGVCGSWQHHFGINIDWIHKPSILNEDLKAAFIYNCELCHSTLMLRKSFFLDNNLFYDKNCAAEDYELWTRAIHKFKFSNLPKVLGEYRIGEDNITAKKLNSLSEESANIAFKNITTYLKVEIPESHVKYLSSWLNEFNNIKNKKEYTDAINAEKEILKQMWINNQKIKAYSEDSLLRVINRRWRWVTNTWIHGTDLGEIFTIDELFDKDVNSEDAYLQAKTIKTQNGIKKYLKGIIRFFYRPFKYKIIDKIRQQLWDLDGHLKDSTTEIKENMLSSEERVINEINELKNELENEIVNIKQMLNELGKNNQQNLEKVKSNILETMDGRIWKAEKNILQTIDGRIWKAELNAEKQIFEVYSLVNTVIENQNNLLMNSEVNSTSKYLLVNDTFNTFHHGCSATSLAIRHFLEMKTDTEIKSIKWQEVGLPEKVYPNNVNDFLSKEFFLKWININQGLVNRIISCEHLVINGEGSVSHYDCGTRNLFYIIYIAKKIYNKKVSLINHSIFTSNYIDSLTLDEQNDFEKIITLVYSLLDNCKIREAFSKKQLDNVLLNNGQLSFDCLPLYIEEIFPFRNEKVIKYITISGGNFLGDWYSKFISKILPFISEKFSDLKVIFLYSEVPYADRNGDMEVYDALKQQLGENVVSLKKVKTTDEWLSVIQNSAIFISGRFHHTIASFMLDTPFFAFKTDTKKVEGVLDVIEKNECLLDNDNISNALNHAKKIIEDESFYFQNSPKIKQKIIELAKNNFENL